MNNLGFYKFNLPLEVNLFGELLDANDFENVSKGRIGNHLVHVSDDGIPIVRTTTKYNIPAHNFSSIHHQIIEHINSVIQDSNLDILPPLHFNNALVEVYDAQYTKMKYHSDQSLDLDADSHIGLFSCYERPEELSQQNLRKLKIKDKVTNEEFEIPLEQNSIVLFSLSQNKKFHHKIVLEPIKGQKAAKLDNRWLGLTFRKSKTFIHFKNDLSYFPNGTLLNLADEEQQRTFYKLRSEENKNMNFSYPDITYTLSLGDTLIPKG